MSKITPDYSGYPSDGREGFTYIYGICDPFTQELRYVGKALNPRVRFWGHLSFLKKNRKVYSTYWLQSVIKKGGSPEFFIIEEVPNASWQDAEIFWISYFRSIGCRLTNLDHGGKGPSRVSDETREKFRKASMGNQNWTGKHHSQETKDKLSGIVTEYFKTNVNPWKGKTHSADSRMKMRESSSTVQWWNIELPDGSFAVIKNLRAFSLDNGLNPKAMHMAYTHGNKTRGGYRVKRATELEINNHVSD